MSDGQSRNSTTNYSNLTFSILALIQWWYYMNDVMWDMWYLPYTKPRDNGQLWQVSMPYTSQSPRSTTPVRSVCHYFMSKAMHTLSISLDLYQYENGNQNTIVILLLGYLKSILVFVDHGTWLNFQINSYIRYDFLPVVHAFWKMSWKLTENCLFQDNYKAYYN